MKQWLLNKLLKHLYKAVTLSDLEKSFYTLSENDQKTIIQLAKDRRHDLLEEWLHEDLSQHAMEMLYKKSQSVDDMVFAKACLYIVELRQNKLKKLRQL